MRYHSYKMLFGWIYFLKNGSFYVCVGQVSSKKHLACLSQDVFCDERGQQEELLGGLRKWMSKGREKRSEGMEVKLE